MNKFPLYKVLFAFGLSLIITMLPILIIYEIETVEFFNSVYKLNHIEGVLCTALAIGIKLCILSLVVKTIKHA